MKSKERVVALFGIVSLFTLAVTAQATITHTWELPDPPEYVRDIGPEWIENHSAVEIYVENILDEQRWKDWWFKVWVEDTEPDVTSMQVDYDLTLDHSNPIWLTVDLVPIEGTSPFEGYKGFYASTFEAAWEQYGTEPVGGQGDYAIGNPAWVSFHLDLPGEGPMAYQVHDECIPEPATILLLGLGGLALIKRKK